MGRKRGGNPSAIDLDRRDDLIDEWRPFLQACENAFNSRKSAMGKIDGAIRAVGSPSAVRRERRKAIEPHADGTGLAVMFADLYPKKSWSYVEPLFREVIAATVIGRAKGDRGAVDPQVIARAKAPAGVLDVLADEHADRAGAAFKKARARIERDVEALARARRRLKKDPTKKLEPRTRRPRTRR